MENSLKTPVTLSLYPPGILYQSPVYIKERSVTDLGLEDYEHQSTCEEGHQVWLLMPCPSLTPSV